MWWPLSFSNVVIWGSLFEITNRRAGLCVIQMVSLKTLTEYVNMCIFYKLCSPWWQFWNVYTGMLASLNTSISCHLTLQMVVPYIYGTHLVITIPADALAPKGSGPLASTVTIIKCLGLSMILFDFFTWFLSTSHVILNVNSLFHEACCFHY